MCKCARLCVRGEEVMRVYCKVGNRSSRAEFDGILLVVEQ
jgi:hypothetical protein